jgi:protein-S-isoprenylcysteine O-methyltransferase Ste14
MNRITAALGSIVFFAIAPGTLALYVPWLLSHWDFRSAFFGEEFTRLPGLVLALGGLAILIDSFARFVIDGIGTPAPIAPPRHLVVSGLYAHVRNPMYVGVLATILGQALLFAHIGLVIYGTIVWAGFHAFVTLYEEPTLRHMFGPAYDAFRAHVPRWIPRLTAWHPDGPAQPA